MTENKFGLKYLISFFKKQLGTFIMGGFLAILIFDPAVKSWILERLVSIGFYNATINNRANSNNVVPVENFYFRDSTSKLSSITNLKGKIVFINFWASWCPPCRAEMPSINNLYLKFKNDNRIAFLFFNEDEDTLRAVSFLKINNFSIPINYTSGMVPDGMFSGSLPTTVILNKQGKLLYKHEGMASYNSEAFIKDLKKLF